MRLRSTNETSPPPLKLVQGSNSDDRLSNDRRAAKAPVNAQPDVRLWVTDHWDVVYKLLSRLTGNRHDAEDLSQETFLKAMERRESFQAGTNLRAWLLRIATNAFLDRQRRKQVLKITAMPDDDVALPRQPDAVTSPGRGLEVAEVHAAVMAAIAVLPETARVVFLLRTEQDMSFRDISALIGTSEETARWHMMQARKQLLARLDGKLDRSTRP